MILDLLPIERPLDTDIEISREDFYKNVVSQLIPDLIKLETTGIPINLDKVKDIELTITNVLSVVKDKLATNKTMLGFLEKLHSKNTKDKISSIKVKDTCDFYKEYDYKNRLHKSRVVNYYLRSINKPDMILDNWTIKDLKKLNQIIASRFISNIISNNITRDMKDLIHNAMTELATDKANIYNKNHVVKKSIELNNNPIEAFNPGSTLQKKQFFEYVGIESESTTPKGEPQFNRKELEKILYLLNNLIEEKEKQYETESV